MRKVAIQRFQYCIESDIAQAFIIEFYCVIVNKPHFKFNVNDKEEILTL